MGSCYTDLTVAHRPSIALPILLWQPPEMRSRVFLTAKIVIFRQRNKIRAAMAFRQMMQEIEEQQTQEDEEEKEDEV